MLSRAAEITGFKGKKEQTVDLLAPQGLKFARARARRHRTSRRLQRRRTGSISAARCAGCSSGKEAPAAHIFLETAGGAIAPDDIASFALGALLRGYKFKKYKTKTRKKNGAAEKQTTGR